MITLTESWFLVLCAYEGNMLLLCLILCCRSDTKGKLREVDTVFTARGSSRDIQSINTDQGQNCGMSCIFYKCLRLVCDAHE